MVTSRSVNSFCGLIQSFWPPNECGNNVVLLTQLSWIQSIRRKRHQPDHSSSIHRFRYFCRCPTCGWEGQWVHQPPFLRLLVWQVNNKGWTLKTKVFAGDVVLGAKIDVRVVSCSLSLYPGDLFAAEYWWETGCLHHSVLYSGVSKLAILWHRIQMVSTRAQTGLDAEHLVAEMSCRRGSLWRLKR